MHILGSIRKIKSTDMKKLLIAVAALLLSAATFAQSNDGPPPAAPNSGQQGRPQRAPMSPEQRAKNATERINKMVPLGDSYQKVYDVYVKFEGKRAAIAGTAKMSELTDEQRTQIRELRKETDGQLHTAMGNDLYTKWKEAEKARRNAGKGGEQGPPPGAEN